VIPRRKVAIVGQYLIARSSKFVAKTSHKTNQRSKSSSFGLYCLSVGLHEELQYTLVSMLQIPAASYLMELAAIDWFKDTKRMDNVARQKGCVAQVNKEQLRTF
jgi:hypothetical protein